MRAKIFGQMIVPVILVLVLGLAGPGGSARAGAPGLAGHWTGEIRIPGSLLTIDVDFIAGETGAWRGDISIPVQGARDLPLEQIGRAGDEVTFAIAGVPGNPAFKGRIAADGLSIRGDFSQGGVTFPFQLDRAPDSQAAASGDLGDLDGLITAAMKTFNVPGLAVAVVKGADVVYMKGFGFRDMDQQLPVTPDTLFAIGSSTKAFTTFVLASLVDEGKLEWDRPVRTWIPGFNLSDPFMSERLTPRDLVTHRSGVPRHDLLWYNNESASRKELVAKLAFVAPNADLREKWQYNNMMFLTAGYLAEAVTGVTWEQAVRMRILDPLGMARTNFSVTDSQKDADFAYGYREDEEKLARMPFRGLTNMGPAGSINSSVREMSHWVIMNLNQGRFGERQVIGPASLAEMHRPQMAMGVVPQRADILPSGYGLGWFTESYRGHPHAHHGGNIDGFSAMVSLFPNDGVGLVILTNLNGTPLRDLLVRHVADRMLHLEPVEWIADAAGKRALGKAAEKEAREKKFATRRPGTQTAHPLEEYAGDYLHPGYGRVTVNCRDGRLEIRYNGIATPLEHWHFETFNGLKAGDPTFEDMKYSFRTDVNGHVAAVAAAFEGAVEDIVFARQPDAWMSDPAALARFAGEYELAGQVVTISVKGDALVATIPGQPAYDLVPGLGGMFALKQARVVSLRFVTDAAGAVSHVEMYQPGGTYTVKRR
jgi:CubicO group peptidase (beta-lactamase class C family)